MPNLLETVRNLRRDTICPVEARVNNVFARDFGLTSRSETRTI
jgi:hypothetical protein